MRTAWYIRSRIPVPYTTTCRHVPEAPTSMWPGGTNERTSRLYSPLIPADASDCDAVAGVVWSAPMWYSIGTISRSAVYAGFTKGRTEW